MNKIDSLPFEIINQILAEFVHQLDKEIQVNEATASEPYLEKSSYTELIKLRLVSRIWSKAVILFYFQTIYIDDEKRAQIILDNWRHDLFGPHFPCPVKRLTIKELWDSEAEESVGCGRSAPPTMNQLARLINVLGKNLKRLKITLKCTMRINPNLMEAIKTIDDLKSSSIKFDYYRWPGTYDLPSLSELFPLIPNLEQLSLHCDSLGRLDLKPPALSKLRYFSFTYQDQFEGIYDIIQASKHTLKFIAISTNMRPAPSLRPVFEPIKETLEGLYSFSIITQLDKSVTDLDFPNLRVIGTRCLHPPIMSELLWLQVPMFKNVRTIVADSSEAELYWQDALKVADGNAFKKVPHFKHIVFTTHKDSDFQEIEPEVFEAFESRGIQCHLTGELTSVEIMELDNTLNGPLKSSQ